MCDFFQGSTFSFNQSTTTTTKPQPTFSFNSSTTSSEATSKVKATGIGSGLQGFSFNPATSGGLVKPTVSEATAKSEVPKKLLPTTTTPGGGFFVTTATGSVAKQPQTDGATSTPGFSFNLASNPNGSGADRGEETTAVKKTSASTFNFGEKTSTGGVFFNFDLEILKKKKKFNFNFFFS